jgi:calcineurin-like phosphoesterase family protein
MIAPSRVAFAGDWHANILYARRAIRHAAQLGADLIVHLGDFGYEFLPAYLDGVTSALRQAGIELWFVDGNHEKFPVLSGFPIQPDGRRRVTDLVYHLPRGFRWQWGGVSFLALGGAYSIDRAWRSPGVSWWPEEEMTDGDISAAMAGGAVDVLVAHDCPTGVPIPGLDDGAGMWPPMDLIRAVHHRMRLRRVVQAVRPRVVWHGHYHVSYDAQVDLGYGPVDVHGLDCDGQPLSQNVSVVDVAGIAGSQT